MDEDEYLERRLALELERLSDAEVRTITRSESSFWSWLSRTVKRIWQGITASWIGELGKWLWSLLFG